MNIYKFFFYAAITLITVLSILPGFGSNQSGSIQIFSHGYLKHCVAYLIISVLLFKSYSSSKKKFLIVAFLFTLIYSAILEFIQYFLPYRTFNLYDILANAIGIILGIIVFIIIVIKKRKSLPVKS